MIRLDTTTRTLEIILTSAKTTNDMSCMVSYSDDVPGISYTGGSKLTYSNGVTAATICSAPGSGAVRDIDFVSVYNADTAPKTVTIRINDNGTFYPLVDVVMQVDDRLDYTHGSGWQILSSAGGTVTSVFGRAGAVVANSADYAAYYAALAGLNTQVFSVAPATAAAHAVPASQPKASQMSGEFTVAANALTFTANPCVADFRSATVTTGAPNTRFLSSASSIVVPSGATLGTINGVQSRIVGGLLDNAGTLEPFVINLSGGGNLNESGIISTTAVSASANSAGVAYSTTARTNVPYRVIAAADITEATSGTWATAPSLVLPSSVLSALSGFGYGQSGADYLASRSYNTTYYNVTGKLMFLCVTGVSSALSALDIDVTQNGVTVKYRSTTASAGWNMAAWAVVPPGASYIASLTAGTITPQIWVEYK